MEAAVAGVWAAALQRENIGTSDDFFALGGDSLAAATVLTGIEELFGVMLSPVALFDEVNTVAKLAAAISGQLGEGRS